MPVPKSTDGFRIAHQFDPIESYIYAALAYDFSPKVETTRVHIDQKIACSYRVSVAPDGALFNADSGWHDYHEKSETECQNTNCDWILVTDIADFYNQISHHRVQNALQSAGIEDLRSKSIERYLGLITSTKTSRGIPVGLSPSSVLAEAVLDDLDKHLLGNGIVFTRYVDDLRVFCKTKKDAVNCLEEICSFLYTSHRLTVQSSKTHLFDKEDFLIDHLTRPEDEDEEALQEEIADYFEDESDPFGYTMEELSIDDIEDEGERAKIVANAIKRLYRKTVAKDSVEFGTLKYLLRKATRLRSRSLYPDLFADLSRVIPVFRDFCMYLNSTLNETAADKYKDDLRKFAFESTSSDIQFLRVWTAWLVSKHPYLMDSASAYKLVEHPKVDHSFRYKALLAKSYNDIAWVRQNKERWMNLGPWDQRAIIWAGSILPKDERHHWLGELANSADPLISVVASHAKS